MTGNGDAMEPLLRLDAVDTFYGPIHILQGLTLEVGAGELVCLLGGNASGKSTTLKTILGIVKPKKGSVHFDGENVTGRTTSHRIKKGMAIVPENRRLFAPNTAPLVVPEWSVQDIDNEDDWVMAETKYEVVQRLRPHGDRPTEPSR